MYDVICICYIRDKRVVYIDFVFDFICSIFLYLFKYEVLVVVFGVKIDLLYLKVMFGKY